MKLGTSIPVLRIFDEDKAREFYIDFLGFTQDWEHRFCPEAPIYQQVSRDGCLLHLTGHHGDACPGSSVRIQSDDVKSYNAELLAKNYKHARPGCEKREWKALEMNVADPFGNHLIFWENLAG